MFDRNNLGEFEPNSVNDIDAILSDVVATGHNCGTYISIALGGATDYGFFHLMEHIGNNPAAPLLQNAVNNVVDFVESNGLDGVDLDLECWWDENNDPNKDQGGRLKSDGSHPAGKGLTEFAKQLKQAMPDKIISAALFATSWYGNCYDPELVEYLDWLGIMTYDLTGSWNQTPVGPQTALLKIREQKAYADEQQGEWPTNRKSSANTTEPMSDNPILSVEDSLWYWTNPFFTNWQGTGQNLKRNKIAAGVPVYGYDFAYGKQPDDLSGQIAPGYKTIRYKDLLNQFPDADTAANGNIKVSGNTSRPPFVSAPGTYSYAHNIYFETPKTAVDKLNFLKSVGTQGVIIWELTNDVWEEGKSIIQALYKNSGNPAIRPPLPSKVTPSLPVELIGVFAGEWSEDTKLSIGSLQNLAVASTSDEESSIGISGSPALAVFDGKLFCVHEGQGEDGWLWCFTFDGQSWSEDKPLLPNHGTSGPPALAVYDGKLFCVHEGRGEDGWLWCCTFDGQSWSEDKPLSAGTGSSRRKGLPSAALAVYKGLLYCVHEGWGGDGWLWFCTFDGHSWSKDEPLGNHGTSGGPALAVVGDLLVCMHEESKEGGWLWKTYFDGNTWSKDSPLSFLGTRDSLVSFLGTSDSPLSFLGNRYGTSGPPALVVHDNKLYSVHEGRGEDGWIWSFNDTDLVDKKLTTGGEQDPIGTSRTPALAVYNDKFYVLHEGQGKNGKVSVTTMPTERQQPEEFNLLMPERPGAPYNTLDRYNTALTQHQPFRDNNHPVEVMRHHMIPDSRLRDFWNGMLEHGHLSAVDGFLAVIDRDLAGYQMTLNETDINQVRDLVRRIRGGQIRHNASSNRPPGFDNLAAVYEWLPGNLFVGPRGGGGDFQRTDDPGDGFEDSAGVIVGTAQFGRLQVANSRIVEYLGNQNSSTARQAGAALSRIAQRRSPFDLNGSNWVFRNRKYKIKPEREHDEL
jgi:GH18 family chitinase